MTKTTTEEEAFQALLDSGQEPPSDLRALVRLAKAIEGNKVAASPAFRAKLRARILAEAARPRSLRERISDAAAERNAAWRRSFRTVAVVGVAVMVLAGTGSVLAASGKALPGTTMYGVKRWREGLVLAAARGDAAKGLLYLEMARTRLEEIQGLADRGVRSGRLYVETLNLMDDHTVNGSTRIVRAFEKDRKAALIRRLGSFAARQHDDLNGILELLPAAARPAALDSLTLLERVQTQAVDILRGCPCAPENPLSPVPAVGLGGVPGAAGASSIRCTCEPAQPIEGGGGAGANPGPSPTPTTDPCQENPNADECRPSPGPTPRYLIPDVDGPGATQNLDDGIDDLLRDALSPLLGPTPLPTPLPSPSVSSPLP